MQTHKIGAIFTLILVIAVVVTGYMYKDTLFGLLMSKEAAPLTEKQIQTLEESLTAPATTMPVNKKEQEQILNTLSVPSSAAASKVPQISEVDQQKILDSLKP